MKKILLLSFLMVVVNMFSVTPSVTFGIKSYYDSNIINLSSNSQDNYLNDFNPDKYKIGSLDDWITQFNVGLGIKHKFFFKHTGYIKMNFLSSNYYQNSIKNNVKFGLSVKQYLSKHVIFNIAYQYYPKIYLRRYQSEFDTSGDYHDFSYAKNSYLLSTKVIPISYLNFKIGINYSQLFYNEYFTEYDTNDTELYGMIKTNNLSTINVAFLYGYKTSKQINEGQYSAIKDPSANYNIYKTVADIDLPQKIKDEFSIRYEEKFFQTNTTEDKYHYLRNDYKTILKNTISYKFNDKYNLKIFADYEKRNTSSPYQNVRDDKSYTTYRFGLNLNIKIK